MILQNKLIKKMTKITRQVNNKILSAETRETVKRKGESLWELSRK